MATRSAIIDTSVGLKARPESLFVQAAPVHLAAGGHRSRWGARRRAHSQIDGLGATHGQVVTLSEEGIGSRLRAGLPGQDPPATYTWILADNSPEATNVRGLGASRPVPTDTPSETEEVAKSPCHGTRTQPTKGQQ